jgi:metal-sulfur cluster biosynthetic enzyme
MQENFYSDELLVLSNDTSFKRGLADTFFSATSHNPLCGDKVKTEFVVRKESIIDCGFSAESCVIAKAATVYALNKLKFLEVTEAKQKLKELLNEISTKDNMWCQILQNPARAKCVTLPWHTALKALTDVETATHKVVKTIYDPELPVNIYDLGLIYKISCDENSINILMTLTTPNCPVADSFPYLVEQTVKEKLGTNKVKVDLTFDPPWTIEKATPDARILLGYSS